MNAAGEMSVTGFNLAPASLLGITPVFFATSPLIAPAGTPATSCASYACTSRPFVHRSAPAHHWAFAPRDWRCASPSDASMAGGTPAAPPGAGAPAAPAGGGGENFTYRDSVVQSVADRIESGSPTEQREGISTLTAIFAARTLEEGLLEAVAKSLFRRLDRQHLGEDLTRELTIAMSFLAGRAHDYNASFVVDFSRSVDQRRDRSGNPKVAFLARSLRRSIDLAQGELILLQGAGRRSTGADLLRLRASPLELSEQDLALIHAKEAADRRLAIFGFKSILLDPEYFMGVDEFLNIEYTLRTFLADADGHVRDEVIATYALLGRKLVGGVIRTGRIVTRDFPHRQLAEKGRFAEALGLSAVAIAARQASARFTLPDPGSAGD